MLKLEIRYYEQIRLRVCWRSPARPKAILLKPIALLLSLMRYEGFPQLLRVYIILQHIESVVGCFVGEIVSTESF